MVVRIEKNEKARKGTPGGFVSYLLFLPLLVGISLFPSMFNTDVLYREIHSKFYYADTATNKRQISPTIVGYNATPDNIRSISSDDSSSSKNLNTTTTTNPDAQEEEKADDPTPNPIMNDTSAEADDARKKEPVNVTQTLSESQVKTPKDATSAEADDATKRALANSTILLSKTNDKPADTAGNSSAVDVPHFEKQEGVVIVTQIHGPHQYGLLKQSFCLLHKAYNSKMLYDLIVFLADPLSDEQVAEMTSLVHPANLTFVNNAPNGLHGLMDDLTPERRSAFLQRCKVNETEAYNLTWWSECPGRLAYNWQAEFRSWRIWRQPALAKYKYMFWLDSDVFATEVWKQDPIAYMVAHDLVVLFAHYGGGRAGAVEVDKTLEFYNKSFCELEVAMDGFLHVTTSRECAGRFRVIHGFSHITNLDFYRSDEVHRWLTHFRADCFLCRKYDDQVAVTVPPAMLAPNRSKDMRKSGLKLNNFHNAMMDGQEQAKPAGFKGYWRQHGKTDFPEADGVCEITERG